MILTSLVHDPAFSSWGIKNQGVVKIMPFPSIQHPKVHKIKRIHKKIFLFQQVKNLSLLLA